MKHSEAWTGARSQIIWILALVLSTTAIIYLEHLDLGAVGRSMPVSAELVEAAAESLANAERDYLASPEAQSASDLILALSVAVQAGVLDVKDGRVRVETLRKQAAAGAPQWEAVSVLAGLTFGR